MEAILNIDTTPPELVVLDDNWDEKYTKKLDKSERDVYAEMIMRSLRGSFFPLKGRIEKLKTIAEMGLARYDEEKIIEKANRQYEREYADGRTWRSVYQDTQVSVTELDEQTVMALGRTIPDDLTWDESRVSRMF